MEQQIGVLPEYVRDIPVAAEAGFSGIPAVDDNGNYYLYLTQMGIVKVFSASGRETATQSLEFLPEIAVKKDYFGTPDTMKDTKNLIAYFYDFFCIGEKLYFIIQDRGGTAAGEFRLIAYEMTKDLKVERRIILPLDEEMTYKPTDLIRIGYYEGNIHVPLVDKNMVVTFSEAEKN